MRMPTLKRTLPVAITLAFAAAVTPASVGALPPQAQEAQAQIQQAPERAHSAPQTAQIQREAAQTQATERATTQRQAVEERRAEASGRLEAAKLKACQNREKAIQNIMTRLADRSTRQLEVFTKISNRAQAFYTEKGYEVANYDTLVADIDAKKAAAESTVASVANSSNAFDCEGDNPKGVATHFKDALHAQNAALKEYRTTIKNLIVGIQTAHSTESATTEESGAQQ